MASAHLLFAARLKASILNEATGLSPLSASPGLLDLTLTAMSADALRIGIAPATAYAHDHELGLADRPWPASLERSGPVRVHTIPWGRYTIRISADPLSINVLENGRVRQAIQFEENSTNIHFSLDGPIFGTGTGANKIDRRSTREGLVNGQVPPDYRTFGARVQIPWVVSPNGWGILIGQPQGTFEFTQNEGIFRGVEATSTRNVFLLLGSSTSDVLREYARLTGFPHMPPRWALGYMQSHRTLASREEVLDVLRTFREKKLPCDAVIYLGTGFCPSGWNIGHGSFTFNENVFRDPAQMIRQMHNEHFQVVLHVVPPGDLHGSITDNGSASQSPGDAVTYWQKHAALQKIGVDGWWPDEGDKFSVYVRFDRNRMYYEGSRQTLPDRRPFALHRNGYIGLQRYGWLWSGDTDSTWRTLRAQIMVGIAAGLSGIPYWGTDIGGFAPTSELTPELYLRWFQWAAFCPCFRGHGRAWHLRLPWGWSTGDPGPKEVEGDWVASWPPAIDLHRDDVEEICRKYLNLRYQLLPYLYSTVSQSHETGLPLIRALSIGWPRDDKAAATDDAYMWGDQILVAPVHEKDAKVRNVYLPPGEWWDFWTSARLTGPHTFSRPVDLETLPLFVKAGAIVPFDPIRQFSGEAVSEPITLRIYPGADGRFTWYDDDGTSYAHEHGKFLRVECVWQDTDRRLALKPDPKGLNSLPETIRIELADSKQSKVIVLPRSGISLILPR
jgi:alpha-glucosidase (family GH31 glycosyl hydrolase)